MCSPCRKLLLIPFILLSLSSAAFAAGRELKVCADPENLPFSNRQLQGFENHIVELLARDMKVRTAYVWQRMGRNFVRDYMDSGRCDILVGIPANFNALATTAPYYRSSYVFVTRRDRALDSLSLNDSRLRTLSIGVQMLRDDYTPPAEGLARRGLQAKLKPFEVSGSGAGAIVSAVADGQIDTAVVWGPLAGYFSRRYPNKFRITPVEPQMDPPALPFTFAISMGVRKGDTVLREELDAFLERRHTDIVRVLREYGVPQLDLAGVMRARR